MAPPQLSGNTPVADALQPVQIRLIETLRHKFQFSALQRLDRRLCHLFHAYKPLLLHHRLYRGFTAVVSTYGVGMGNHLYEKAQFLQILYDGFSGLVALHPIVLAARQTDGRVVVHNRKLRKVVAFAHLEVVRVMGRCNLYTSGTEFFVYVGVGNHRDGASRERQLKHLSNEIGVALILRINRHSRITEKRLRSRGCDLHKGAFLSRYRIIDMPEKSVLVHMLYLCVRYGGLAYRAPVDDSGSLVNIAFLIQTDKYFLHRFRTALVHGKTFSVPVCGGAHLMQLVDNASAVFLSPVPAFLQESVTAQVLLIDALLL